MLADRRDSVEKGRPSTASVRMSRATMSEVYDRRDEDVGRSGNIFEEASGGKGGRSVGIVRPHTAKSTPSLYAAVPRRVVQSARVGKERKDPVGRIGGGEEE
ncbi:hypothetical protein HK097_006318, partial [Rhizophlyctis rosea]